MVTITELRNLIQQEGIIPELVNNAKEGILKSNLNEDVFYEIFIGWDLAKANQCDSFWGGFNIDLIQFIKDQKYSDDELQELESYVQLGDSHWDWLWKSCRYHTNEYEWFFLYADGKPQAACLIYHPKKSIIHEKEIFYIEYIAVAPWNRRNPMEEKKLAGLGQLMINFVVNYATKELGLHLGFSLHSVPTAVGFYEGLGMRSFESEDKEGLKFYEMPAELAQLYLEAS